MNNKNVFKKYQQKLSYCLKTCPFCPFAFRFQKLKTNNLTIFLKRMLVSFEKSKTELKTIVFQIDFDYDVHPYTEHIGVHAYFGSIPYKLESRSVNII